MFLQDSQAETVKMHQHYQEEVSSFADFSSLVGME